MSWSESQVAQVMTLLAGADSRFKLPAEPRKINGEWVVDPIIITWKAVLDRERIRFQDAWEGTLDLIAEPMLQVAQVGHIVAAAKKHRRARLAAVPDEAFIPPDDLPAGAWPKWLQAARNAVVDGHPVEDALRVADEAMGVKRRLSGPTVKRDLSLLSVGRAL